MEGKGIGERLSDDDRATAEVEARHAADSMKLIREAESNLLTELTKKNVVLEWTLAQRERDLRDCQYKLMVLLFCWAFSAGLLVLVR